MTTALGDAAAEFAPSVRGYLDTPTMGLLPLRAGERVRAALDAWTAGQADYEVWEGEAEACRTDFAALLGVPADRVTLQPSIVPAVASVAGVLARRSGAVVAHRAEFQSLLLPVVARVGEERVRWVDGPYVSDTFLAALEPGVSAVLVSSVASHDGGRPDLARLARACRDAHAELAVDATQSLGVVGLGVPAEDLGAVFVAGYKWLAGPRGAAYAYVRDDLVKRPPVTPGPNGVAGTTGYGAAPELRPGAAALDASRAWLSWVGARPGLELLRAVPEADREAHATSLADRLRRELQEMGLTSQPTDRPSPIVSVAAPSPEELAAALRAEGVRCAVRLGRVRFGLHVYNSAEDVERVARAVGSSSR